MIRQTSVAVVLAAAALPLASTLPAAADPADPNGSMVSCTYKLPENPEPKPDLADETRDFAQAWFDDLANHAPAEHMLTYLDLHSLVMSFPQVASSPPMSVCDEASFRQWYNKIGAEYADQHYEILSLDTAGTGDQPIVHLSVAWSGKDAQSGQPFNYTTEQAWSLARGGPRGFGFEAYLVNDVNPA